MRLEETAKKYEDYLAQMRYHFHAHPEVSEKEFETLPRHQEKNWTRWV